jgi:hypothetical protein
VALKEQITAAAPIACLEKGDMNTTLIRMNLTGLGYWQPRQHHEGCDKLQLPKDNVPFCEVFGIVYHGQFT